MYGRRTDADDARAAVSMRKRHTCFAVALLLSMWLFSACRPPDSGSDAKRPVSGPGQSEGAVSQPLPTSSEITREEEAGPRVRIDAVEPRPALHALLDLFERGVNHPLAPTRWRVTGLAWYDSMHKAIAAGDLYAVVDRVAGGGRLDERDAEGRTPLLIAAAENQPFIADFLLDRGTSLEEKDLLGNSVLHLAARASHVYTLENFLRRGALIDARNQAGYTPLHKAAEAGELFAVQHLVARGADMFALQDNEVLSIPAVLAARNRHWEVTRFFRSRKQYFPVHMMAAQGDLPGVAEAIADMPAAVNLFDALQNTPLISAIQTGECETAAVLLDAGADPGLRNLEGDSPLTVALRRGDFACADLLLQRGANINEPLVSGLELTHLGQAVRSAPEQTVAFILEHGGDPRGRWGKGRTALHVAVEIDDVEKVRLLVKAGAEPVAFDDDASSPLLRAAQRGRQELIASMTSKPELLDLPAPGGRRPLHEAAAHGHLDVVDWLLSQGVSASPPDEKGETPLHLAAWAGKTSVLSLLLERGAAIDVEDKQGDTPFLSAVEGGEQAAVALLLSHGADGRHVNRGCSGALHAALSHHHITLAHWLQEQGIPVDQRDSDGRSALFPAARCGDFRVLRWLNELGLPLDESDHSGRSLLHEAVARGDLESVRFLLEAGLAADTGDASSLTALHLAAARGNTSILKLLLDAGATVDARDRTGQTPLHHAAQHGRGECVAWLLTRGAELNAADEEGATPMMRAALFGHFDATLCLLRRGAALEAVNSKGVTVLQAAEESLKNNSLSATRQERRRLHAWLNAALLEAFRAAATWGDVERMMALLDAYPAFCDVATFGRTPAHWAALHGQTAILQLLRERGADLLRRADTESGEAPVHLAAMNGHRETVAWLLDNGTPPDWSTAAGEAVGEVRAATATPLPGEKP